MATLHLFFFLLLILSGVSTAGGSGGVHSRDITQVAFTASPPSASASDEESGSTFKQKGYFSPLNESVSAMLQPPGTSAVAAAAAAAAQIHRFRFFLSSPTPVSKPLSARLFCDFSVGVCGGGCGGSRRCKKHTISPHGAASSATQRQRTAEAERNRRQAPRCHARDTYYGFTHVRTHAG